MIDEGCKITIKGKIMESNVFSTPEADLIDANNDINSDVSQEFYVTSKNKFITLYVATMGLYSLFWFYQNWRLYKIKNNEHMWPVMRAIFSIFFTHSLFEAIDSRLKRDKVDFSWNHNFLATVFVIASIISEICDRLSNNDVGGMVAVFVPILILPILGGCLFKAQQAVNFACGDEEGEINNQFTAANYI